MTFGFAKFAMYCLLYWTKFYFEDECSRAVFVKFYQRGVRPLARIWKPSTHRLLDRIHDLQVSPLLLCLACSGGQPQPINGTGKNSGSALAWFMLRSELSLIFFSFFKVQVDKFNVHRTAYMLSSATLEKVSLKSRLINVHKNTMQVAFNQSSAVDSHWIQFVRSLYLHADL